MSYLQIKRLVDEHVKQLNTPMVADDEIRRFAEKHGFSEKKMASILLKCNLAIKRHNKSVYNKQVVHQIVQQVLKSEQEKVNEVNARLTRLYQMMQPITVNGINAEALGTIKAISRLSDELPESRHLFAFSDIDRNIKNGETGNETDGNETYRNHGETDGNETNRNHGESDGNETNRNHSETDGNETNRNHSETDGNHENYPESNLIHAGVPNSIATNLQSHSHSHSQVSVGDADMDRLHREVTQEVQLKVAQNLQTRIELREQYESLRNQLLALNEEILYHQEKLSYLSVLGQKLHLNSKKSGADLSAQMGRFGILVEKLDFSTE